MNVKLVTLFLLIVRLMSVSIKIYCPCSVLFTLTMTGRACMHAQSSNKMFIKILSSSALYFLLSKKLNYSCLHSQQPSENNNFCKIILAFIYFAQVKISLKMKKNRPTICDSIPSSYNNLF